MDILVVLEDKNGRIHRMSLEAIAGAQQIGSECGLSIGILAFGKNASALGDYKCTAKQAYGVTDEGILQNDINEHPNYWLNIVNTGKDFVIDRENPRVAIKQLKNVENFLLNKGVLGVFPEGTRSRREEGPFLSEGKTGVARLAASHPDAPIHPAAIMGAREIMAPGDKIIRFGKRVNVTYGEGITWNEWIVHPLGGAQDEASIRTIIESDEEQRRDAMGKLYRKFTNQVIGTLAALGAP